MIMSQMTLNILKEDIETSSYIDGSDCAITRALQRAGYHGYKDCGMDIEDQQGEIVVNNNNEDYHKLTVRVMNMYHGIIPIKDFTVTINY